MSINVTISTTGTYYHLTPDRSDAETTWKKGGPRKGTENGQVGIGFIEFNPDDIIEVCKDNYITSADLILTRDTDYGTGKVDMSLTLVPGDYSLGTKTLEQCINDALETWHTQATVSSSTCTIHLPGYYLYHLKTGDTNMTRGFLIFQFPGEGTTKPVRFKTNASLRFYLYTAADLLNNASAWPSLYWMRPIGKGDVVCQYGRSHVADLREILYYINLRRLIHGMSAVSHSSIILQYADPNTSYRIQYIYWPTIIRNLQDLVDGIYTAEGKTAITWLRTGDTSQADSSSNHILPNAAIINQLRNALEAKVSNTSQKKVLDVTLFARTYFDNYGSDFTVNKNEATTWSQRGPWSGMNWEYTTNAQGERVKKFNRRFGIWILKPLMSGRNDIQTAKLRITKTGGNNNDDYQVTLYPVKVSSLPSTRVSVNAVFKNTTEIMGMANASVGETVDIPLTASAISKLCDSSNTDYCGVGVDDHDYWANFGTSATLIING